MVETHGPLPTSDTALTARCPFCHTQTKQVHTIARDPAGNRIVDLVVCLECGRDLL
jgi:uncharacterized Zn finger protein